MFNRDRVRSLIRQQQLTATEYDLIKQNKLSSSIYQEMSHMDPKNLQIKQQQINQMVNSQMSIGDFEQQLVNKAQIPYDQVIARQNLQLQNQQEYLVNEIQLLKQQQQRIIEQKQAQLQISQASQSIHGLKNSSAPYVAKSNFQSNYRLSHLEEMMVQIDVDDFALQYQKSLLNERNKRELLRQTQLSGRDQLQQFSQLQSKIDSIFQEDADEIAHILSRKVETPKVPKPVQLYIESLDRSVEELLEMPVSGGGMAEQQGDAFDFSAQNDFGSSNQIQKIQQVESQAQKWETSKQKSTSDDFTKEALTDEDFD